MTDLPSTFLHLTAESAMTALRDLDALNDIWHDARCRWGPALASSGRDRMPDRLHDRQTQAVCCRTGGDRPAGDGMLRQLRAAAIAREATGRQSFRAFSLRL